MRSLLVGLPLFVLACAAPPSPSAGPDAGAVREVPGTLPSAAPPASTAAATPTAETTPPDTIAAQHLLVTYKGAKDAPKGVMRSKAEAKTRAEEARTKANAGTDFSELVAQYSEDPGSKERQGSLGKFGRASKVKPFADAAFALPVDGISDVVETPFGFHVIKRNQ